MHFNPFFYPSFCHNFFVIFFRSSPIQYNFKQLECLTTLLFCQQKDCSYKFKNHCNHFLMTPTQSFAKIFSTFVLLNIIWNVPFLYSNKSLDFPFLFCLVCILSCNHFNHLMVITLLGDVMISIIYDLLPIFPTKPSASCNFSSTVKFCFTQLC